MCATRSGITKTKCIHSNRTLACSELNRGNGRISLSVALTMTGSWNITLLAAGGGVTATQIVAVSTGEANNEAPMPLTTRLSAPFNAVANDSIFTLSVQDAGAGRDGTEIRFLLVESTDFILTNASSAGATASVEIDILDDATNVFRYRRQRNRRDDGGDRQSSVA